MIKLYFATGILITFFVLAGIAQDPDYRSPEMPGPEATPRPAKSTVRGRVFYADTGRAVKRAAVMLIAEDGNGPGESGGVTDSEGFFQIRNVAAGAYYPMINAPGIISPIAYADFSKSRDKEIFSRAFTEFEKIIVNGMTDIDIQVPARRGGAIGGRVTYDDGDPAIGVKVEVLRKLGDDFMPVIANLSAMFSMVSGGGGGASYQTDDRGIYRFSGLPPGEYKVKVTENISHTDGQGRNPYDPFVSALLGGSAVFSIYYPDLLDADKAQIINIEPGTEQSEINVVIPNTRLYRITGKLVSGANKVPVKGALVSLRRVGESAVSALSAFDRRATGSQSVSSDAQGVWNFKELPKGTYHVVIEPGGGDTYDESTGYANTANTVANYRASNSMSNGRPATPPPPRLAKKIEDITIDDKDVSDLVFEMGHGAAMSGTVVVENSSEIPTGVTVTTVHESGEAQSSDSIGEQYEGESPTHGQALNVFKIQNIVAGKSSLSISLSGQKYYVKSATLDGRDLLNGPIELKDGDNLKNVAVTLGKDVGTLTGKVLDADKEPVKNGKFVLVSTDSAKAKNPTFYQMVSTDEKGDFSVTVGAGEYSVIFDIESMARNNNREEFEKRVAEAIKAGQKVTIREKETTTVKIISPSP